MNSMAFSINQPSFLGGILKELYTMAGAKKSFKTILQLYTNL